MNRSEEVCRDGEASLRVALIAHSLPMLVPLASCSLSQSPAYRLRPCALQPPLNSQGRVSVPSSFLLQLHSPSGAATR